MPSQAKLKFPTICAGLLVLFMTLVGPASARPTAADAGKTPVSQDQGGLTAQQQNVLRNLARDTWNFYAADVDTNTSLPRDNIGF